MWPVYADLAFITPQASECRLQIALSPDLIGPEVAVALKFLSFVHVRALANSARRVHISLDRYFFHLLCLFVENGGLAIKLSRWITIHDVAKKIEQDFPSPTFFLFDFLDDNVTSARATFSAHTAFDRNGITVALVIDVQKPTR